MNVDLLLSTVISGLTAGLTFALLALAIVFIYRTIGVINFAVGEIALLLVYFCWSLMQWQVSAPLAFVSALALGALLGPALQLCLFEPLARRSGASQEKSTAHILEIATLGLILIIHGFHVAVYGDEIRQFPALFTHSYFQLFLFGTICCALVVLIERSHWGLVARGIMSNSYGAQILGYPVRTLRFLSWSFSGCIGALAGFVSAHEYFLHPGTMMPILVYGFTAAVIAGLSSYQGALVCGIALGICDSFLGVYASHFISNEFRLSTLLGFGVLMLLVKPSGLFGRKVLQRI